MSRGEFGTPGDGRGVELAREYLATHGPAAPHVNRLLEMDRDAVMEAAAERVCGPVGCPPGSVFDGKEDSLADAVHQAVAAALEKLEQLGYPVTFGPVPASPLADLPATLASVDDVAKVCEVAGLGGYQKPSEGSGCWGIGTVAIVSMISPRPGQFQIHVDRGQDNTIAVFYPDAPAVLLYSAIQAARSTS